MSTSYTVSLNIGGDATNENGSMTFTDAAGMTDDLALALVKAIRALPWPAQGNVSCSVTRTVRDETQTQGDPVAGVFI
jgi:hypothetical protein